MAMSNYGTNMGPIPNISPTSTYGSYQPLGMGQQANMNISAAGYGPNTSLSPSMYAPNMSYPQSKQGPMSVAALATPYVGGIGVSTGSILVLFILLVIILRSCI